MLAKLDRLRDFERGELELVQTIGRAGAGLEDHDPLPLHDRRAHAARGIAPDFVAAPEDGAVAREMGYRRIPTFDAVDDDHARRGSSCEDLRLAALRRHAHGEVDSARVGRQHCDDPT